MDCKNFQLKINDFLYDQMTDDDEIMDFIIHARNCADCYEDLEIYYTIFHGLDLVEDSKDIEFSHKNLENLLDYYADGIIIRKRVRQIGMITSMFARALAFAVAVFYFFHLILI